MTAKMNWDRARKESQSRSSKIDWIGQDNTGPKPGPEHRQAPTNTRNFKNLPFSQKVIVGCTCKKTIGFKGEHKQACPLRSLPKGHGAPYAATLSGKTNPSSPVALKAILQNRMHVYLRAENRDAVCALQSAATELGLKLYKFQCSSRTKYIDLSGVPGPTKAFHLRSFRVAPPNALRMAFANGGIVCIESVEKASSNFQFWLKDWLNVASVYGGISAIKKHADFMIVVTSPKPARQLWLGRIDAAFLDCLAYVDMTSGGPSSTS